MHKLGVDRWQYFFPLVQKGINGLIVDHQSNHPGTCMFIWITQPTFEIVLRNAHAVPTLPVIE